ncbi:MAG: prepilin-type N-terminal cleavage/methylation domain-containing protein [Peptoniphilaceae bacterium]|nr:prepilin-type N-terminal cleavage/methylation domain-containing protein [Peptoniphilaceae bacterium]MDY3738207.1 prepilin-type N-terminal cleavage/methylation domain-containing protein [Peptoniphilaceae bacterium]
MKNKGFTLIELVITIAISSIMFILIQSIMNFYIKTQDSLVNDIQFDKKAKSTFIFIENEIEESLSIEETLNKKCNFKIRSRNSDGSISSVYYELSGHKLYRRAMEEKNSFTENSYSYRKNILLEGVYDIDFNYYEKNNLVDLKLYKNKNELFHSVIKVG